MSYSRSSFSQSQAERPVSADYSQWSIEELWQLASQLRVTGARSKSRRELIDLFAVPSKAAHR
jgi:hypothetical protein